MDTVPPAPIAAFVPATEPSTLSGSLKTLFNAARSKLNVSAELTAAQTQVTKLTTDLGASATRITQLENQNAQFASQLATCASFFGLEVAALTGKTDAEFRALMESKISAAVVDVAASQGIPQSALPAVTKEIPAEAKKVLTRAEFSALSTQAKMDFSTNGGRLTE